MNNLKYVMGQDCVRKKVGYRPISNKSEYIHTNITVIQVMNDGENNCQKFCTNFYDK
jgi:hypothetical protein